MDLKLINQTYTIPSNIYNQTLTNVKNFTNYSYGLSLFSSINTFNFLERFCTGAIAIYTIYLYIKAMKVIFKDRNSICDKMDKYIVVIAFLQVFCAAIYFLLL